MSIDKIGLVNNHIVLYAIRTSSQRKTTFVNLIKAFIQGHDNVHVQHVRIFSIARQATSCLSIVLNCAGLILQRQLLSIFSWLLYMEAINLISGVDNDHFEKKVLYILHQSCIYYLFAYSFKLLMQIKNSYWSNKIIIACRIIMINYC